jgi:hypothetical protein
MKRPGLYEYPARQTQRSRQLDRFLCARHVCRADGLRGTVPPNQREGNRRQRHHWQQWRLEETEGRLGTQRERTDVGLESGYVRLKWEHEANDVEVLWVKRSVFHIVYAFQQPREPIFFVKRP